MTRTPEETELIKSWLLFAADNLQAAKFLLKEGNMAPCHTICSNCQGAAEKYLKAYLVSVGWQLVKTHDLKKLLESCKAYDSAFLQLFPEAEILNDYISEGRYPGDLPWDSIGEAEAQEAVTAADKIAQFAVAKIRLS